MSLDPATLSTPALHALLNFTDTGTLADLYTGLRAEARAELDRRTATETAAVRPHAQPMDPAGDYDDGDDLEIPPGVLLDIPDPLTAQHVPTGTRYGTQRGNLRSIL